MNVDEPARSRRIAELGFDYDAQPKEPVATCNLCGKATWVVITHRDRYDFAATTTACRTCSLSVLNPRMTRDAYSDFYKATYRPLVSAYHGRLIDAKSVQEEQAPYAVHIGEIINRVPRQGAVRTMLDIGGSTGVVAAHLASEFDLEATIIDPAPDEIAQARALGIDTITGFVEEWEARDRTFDLVGMFQTIDHLLDVARTLRIIHDVLSRDGLFVVDIVDFRAAYLRGGSVEDATKIDHPFSLTEITMEAYLRRCGFSVALKSFAPDHLHVTYVCRKGTPDPRAMPSSSSVDRFFDEIRSVQNSPDAYR